MRAEPAIIFFDSGVPIPIGAKFTITVMPGFPFRGEMLTIPGRLAEGFHIYSIRVGINSQLLRGGLSAKLLALNVDGPESISRDAPDNANGNIQFVTTQLFHALRSSSGAELLLDVALPGQVIAMEVINESRAPRRFFTGMLGSAIR